MSDTGLSPEEFRRKRDYEQAERKRLREEQRAFRGWIFAALRAGRFDEAEAALLERLGAAGVAKFDVARGARVTTPPGSVRVWIGEMIETARKAPREQPLAAIEIDIANAGLAFMQHAGPADPEIEVTGYTDEFFPFSTAGDAEIAAACEAVATPWQGCFDWFPESPRYTLEGLGALNAAVLNHKYGLRGPESVWIGDRLEATPEAVAAGAAELMIGVAFHRFMYPAVGECRVPFPPVIVAGGNDEPNIATIHYRPPVTPSQAVPPRTLGSELRRAVFGRRGV
jgi:hypothetical protein